MRQILVILGCLICFSVPVLGAEVGVSLVDGTSFQGEILKQDDNGLQMRVGEVYTNIAWSTLSQESLKQLASDPKIKPRVEPFIEPETSQHPPKHEITVHDVKRLAFPSSPSIFGGLISSSIGKFLLFILFLANLYAAYEISVVKARPPAQVIGLSAILPIIGPIIFLLLPMLEHAPEVEPVEHAAPAGTAAAAAQAAAANPQIEIAEASWKQPEEVKIEPQVFSRGKFTFNKKFVETKFAGFVGTDPKGDAIKYWMEVRSTAVHIGAAYIESIGATEAVFMTDNGQVTVPLADIQEIKLNPRPT